MQATVKKAKHPLCDMDQKNLVHDGGGDDGGDEKVGASEPLLVQELPE